MCIIIYKPQGIKLLPETITNSFHANPDGAGFSYVENGQIHTHRGFFTVESFVETYEPHAEKQALLHFRIRTHGNYEENNHHPFQVTPELVFAHNGVIYNMPIDKDKSDSLLFSELILKNLIRVYGIGIITNPQMREILTKYIGQSRIVFLNNQ